MHLCVDCRGWASSDPTPMLCLLSLQAAAPLPPLRPVVRSARSRRPTQTLDSGVSGTTTCSRREARLLVGTFPCPTERYTWNAARAGLFDLWDLRVVLGSKNGYWGLRVESAFPPIGRHVPSPIQHLPVSASILPPSLLCKGGRVFPAEANISSWVPCSELRIKEQREVSEESRGNKRVWVSVLVLPSTGQTYVSLLAKWW